MELIPGKLYTCLGAIRVFQSDASAPEEFLKNVRSQPWIYHKTLWMFLRNRPELDKVFGTATVYHRAVEIISGEIHGVAYIDPATAWCVSDDGELLLESQMRRNALLRGPSGEPWR